MFFKIKKSLSLIDYKLLTTLMLVQLVPTLYTTLRVFFLGQLPGEYAYSIAGQLTWINLVFEVVNEAIILPLYFFIGKSAKNKNELNNCFRSGMAITFCIYVALAVLVSLFVKPMLVFMAVNKNILEESAIYIRLESIAAIFSALSGFVLVVLVTLNKVRFVHILTGVRLIVCMVLDVFFVSSFSYSMKLGVNGIAFSNIIVNIVVLTAGLVLLYKEDRYIFKKQKLSFLPIKEMCKIGSISGLESFVRNFAYIVMISRMVNVVNEQGTYWVANNFIWCWLLLPVSQLGEYIKKDVATDTEALKKKSPGYFAITSFIIMLWFVSVPLWKSFMSKVLLFDDVNKLFKLVLILVGFYVLYAFQNVFDAAFYGLGKTNYMLFESVVTNSLYYGTAFILYITKIWIPTLTGIALLFGIGMAFDSSVSFAAYRYLLRKNKVLGHELSLK